MTKMGVLGLIALLSIAPAWAREASRGGAIGRPSVVAEAERHVGQGNFTGRPGAWCGYFVSAILRATGHRQLANGQALSALAYGPRTGAPRPGDLAVMRSHVGFVIADLGRTIEIVSGNWGHRVAVTMLPRRAFVAFIRI